MSLFKWLLAAVALVACILWMYPKILTGDYAEITIGEIVIDPNGQTSLGYSAIVSNETPLVDAFYDGDQYTGGGSGTGGGLFGRPTNNTAGVMFALNPERMHGNDDVPESVWRKRLLVHENQIIRLRAGERLYFYNFQSSDGVRHEGYTQLLSTQKLARN